MSSITPRGIFLPASGPCAAILLATLAHPGTAGAATRVVGNCDDSGTGSLRDVVALASQGDTIDLRQLACKRILLTSGQIDVRQNDLTLLGRDRLAHTIDGGLADRVLQHSGTGILRLRRVSIANGRESNGDGGCIHSSGSVELIHARIHDCRTLRDEGGGIYASNRIVLSHSSAFGNVAEDRLSSFGGALRAAAVKLDHSKVYGNRAGAMGGGVYGGSVTAIYSSIRNNQAPHAAGILAGCAQGCSLTLRKSTVAGNRAEGAGSVSGGFDAGAADSTLIVDSTISDNVAESFSGGWVSRRTRIFNSTIAFNQETGTCSGAINARQLKLVSSIVSRNTCSLGDDKDIGMIDGDDRITGSNNLIGVSDVAVPADTITARPRLGPLADNGGPTPTRMPSADSPAIDRGLNPLDCLYDQRGPGFSRVKGVSADIGAVER